eukprot:TRINITY_DN668_c0_g2_i4.p1 TRINITY_DN668_c0_g2~~TRINITY_DN668_c0_g2_i4.p1  ORF type:complete len:467 (+),score=46.25 TRINITY_DN668_c0_g2_i4:454-1854(+)
MSLKTSPLAVSQEVLPPPTAAATPRASSAPVSEAAPPVIVSIPEPAAAAAPASAAGLHPPKPGPPIPRLQATSACQTAVAVAPATVLAVAAGIQSSSAASAASAEAAVGAVVAVAGAKAAATAATKAAMQGVKANLPGNSPLATANPTTQGTPSQSRPWHLYQFLIGFGSTSIVKTICILGNVAFQVSPFPQVRRWQSNGCGSTEDSAPYVSIALTGYQWSFYGAFACMVTGRKGFLVLLQSNILGAILGTYYIISFARYCHHEALLDQFRRYMSAGAAVAVFQAASIPSLPADRALFLAGIISSLSSILSASALLVGLPAVIKTGDGTSIPGPMIGASLLCGVSWSICGWMIDDPLVTGPSAWGVICAMACLVVKLRYSVASKAQPDKDAVPPTLEEASHSDDFTAMKKHCISNNFESRCSLPNSVTVERVQDNVCDNGMVPIVVDFTAIPVSPSLHPSGTGGTY